MAQSRERVDVLARRDCDVSIHRPVGFLDRFVGGMKEFGPGIEQHLHHLGRADRAHGERSSV
jgi:hypothetical protein